MITDQTVRRLRSHAGLGPPDDASSPSISAATASHSAGGADLDAAVRDFIETLVTLNNELNGATPSEERPASLTVIPREVAYAVAEVIRMLREDGSGRETWLVETGWLGVLAGDIDDLRRHLAEEEAARRQS